MKFTDITLADVSTEAKVETLGIVLDKKFAELNTVVSTVEAQKGDKGDKGERGDKGDKGDKGDAGAPGIAGKDGRDGNDGRNGADGKDGVDAPRIVDAEIAMDDTLLITLSDGTEIKTTRPIVSQGEAVRTLSSTRVVTETTPSYAVRYDQVTTSTSYRGEAVSGSSESSAVWRIQKIVVINDDVTVTWAEGTTNFNYAWTDRLSLSYS